MVDAVANAEIEIGHGGKLEESTEVDDPGGLLTGEARQFVKVARKAFVVPAENVDRCDAALGPRDIVEVEGAINDAAIETVFGGGDVPGDFGGAAGLGIRAVVGVDRGDGANDAGGGAVLVLDGRKLVLQEERGLFGGKGDHQEVTSAERFGPAGTWPACRM